MREFSNYLSPRAGLLSTDAWTLLGTILHVMAQSVADLNLVLSPFLLEEPF